MVLVGGGVDSISSRCLIGQFFRCKVPLFQHFSDDTCNLSFESLVGLIGILRLSAIFVTYKKKRISTKTLVTYL